MARPKVAASVKQPVLMAVKVPASPTSDTKPARKLLDAIGRRPTTKKRKPRPAAKQRKPRPAAKPRKPRPPAKPRKPRAAAKKSKRKR